MALYKHQSEKGISSLFFKRYLHHLKSLQLLKPQKTDRILEIGCNNGELVKFLRKYSKFVTGIDVNRAVIEISPIKDLKVMSVEKLEFADCSFNKIISVHTLEHVPDLKKAFTEIERVLRKGGLCILIYPLEVIRGANIFFKAWQVHGNPFVCRQLHLHKLNPDKIKSLTNLILIEKGVFFGPYPTYYTILKKN